ncbi:MAG: response regulator [Deltaproteobacteria bacterium]|nr:response regulator [Deltaproteobacteria bacterium]
MTSQEGQLPEGVGRKWRQYYDSLRASIKVLVVDDEPVVYRVLEAIMEGAGFAVEVAESAEQALEMIERRSYGLMITDKNLPGMSGVDLIARLKETKTNLPSLVVTGYASVESIASALAAGASDYVTKPFDIEHVRKRATSIIDRNLLTRLYDRIVADLTDSFMESGDQRERVQRIGRELFAFKNSLRKRPDVQVVAAESGPEMELAEYLRGAGHTVTVEHAKEAAVANLGGDQSPIASLVSLQVRYPVSLVADLRRWDPLINVVVTSQSPNLLDALAAVEAGATDFFIQSVERPEALEVRVRRAIETSRRDRLYLKLIGILQREAAEQGWEIFGDILELVPSDHREYLERLVATERQTLPDIDVDLTDLFDAASDAPFEERRSHKRSSATEVEIWFRPLDARGGFARCWLRDLSLGGFFMRTDLAPPRGTRIEVQLLMRGDPPSEAVALTGRVVRNEIHEPDPDMLSGSGVLVQEEDQRKLEPLIARLEGDEQT